MRERLWNEIENNIYLLNYSSTKPNETENNEYLFIQLFKYKTRLVHQLLNVFKLFPVVSSVAQWRLSNCEIVISFQATSSCLNMLINRR